MLLQMVLNAKYNIKGNNLCFNIIYIHVVYYRVSLNELKTYNVLIKIFKKTSLTVKDIIQRKFINVSKLETTDSYLYKHNCA